MVITWIHLGPSFFSFVNNADISLAKVLLIDDLSSLLHLPLSEETYVLFQDLQQLIQSWDIHD